MARSNIVARTVEALVTPELVRWARETAALSLAQAAKRIDASEARLSSWEAGQAKPSVAQLRKLAQAYARPVALFYLPAPPVEPALPTDFRRIDIFGQDSRELRVAIRRAHSRREVALELRSALDEQPPALTISATPSANPAEVAARAREQLGVSGIEQLAWKDPYRAWRRWRESVESLGVLVFQVSGVDLAQMRGFSINARPLPAIGVNAKDAVKARVFSLFHELGHLALGDGGLCDLEVELPAANQRRKETFCNRFAAELLVPRGLLEQIQGWANRPARAHWRVDDISDFAKRCSVSDEAMLYRLSDLSLIDDAVMRRIQSVLRQRRGAATGGFVYPYQKAIANAGPAFARLVLDAFHRDVITLSDVSDYLDLKVKHVPRLEEAVYGAKSEEAGQ